MFYVGDHAAFNLQSNYSTVVTKVIKYVECIKIVLKAPVCKKVDFLVSFWRFET